MDNSILFEKIYEKHFEKIYRFFVLRSLNREIAEDLTSSTFLAFAEALSKSKEMDNIENYIYGIAKIKFIEYLKLKYNETPLLSDNYEIVDIVNEANSISSDQRALNKYLYRLIEKLPKKQKIVMNLRILQKLKLSEVAESLGKDLNYVKTTQKRAIRKLKELASKMYT